MIGIFQEILSVNSKTGWKYYKAVFDRQFLPLRNPLVPKLPSYIKDTTHFLKKLDDLKELPPGSLLVTLDVSSLYTNIPHNEGIEACRKARNSSDHLSRSHLKTESICDLMRMILTMNNFEFDNNYYIQLHGTAMGTRMAPAYANVFMGDLERKLLAQSPLKPFIWWRYMDDIFMVWTMERKNSTNS